jgi:hypothetical protein
LEVVGQVVMVLTIPLAVVVKILFLALLLPLAAVVAGLETQMDFQVVLAVAVALLKV